MSKHYGFTEAGVFHLRAAPGLRVAWCSRETKTESIITEIPENANICGTCRQIHADAQELARAEEERVREITFDMDQYWI